MHTADGAYVAGYDVTAPRTDAGDALHASANDSTGAPKVFFSFIYAFVINDLSFVVEESAIPFGYASNAHEGRWYAVALYVRAQRRR